jgi:hypothetical protein
VQWYSFYVTAIIAHNLPNHITVTVSQGSHLLLFLNLH